MGRKIRRDSFGRQADNKRQVRKNHIRVEGDVPKKNDSKFFTGTEVHEVMHISGSKRGGQFDTPEMKDLLLNLAADQGIEIR